MPGRYWHQRYREALDKAEQSRDPVLRDIYNELADHYLKMELLVRETDSEGNAEDPAINPKPASSPRDQ